MGRRARMRKLREEDLEELAEQLEVEPEKATAVAQDTKQAPAVDKALELQKSAGNRAVGAMLSRWPGFGAPLAAQWPKEAQVIIDGTSIPLESYQDMTQASANPSSSTNRPDHTGPGEFLVEIKSGDYSPGLFRRASGGPAYKTVEIVIPTRDGKGIRFILSEVLISGYSVSSDRGRPLESLTLNFKKREFSQDPPPNAGRR